MPLNWPSCFADRALYCLYIEISGIFPFCGDHFLENNTNIEIEKNVIRNPRVAGTGAPATNNKRLVSINVSSSSGYNHAWKNKKSRNYCDIFLRNKSKCIVQYTERGSLKGDQGLNNRPQTN